MLIYFIMTCNLIINTKCIALLLYYYRPLNNLLININFKNNSLSKLLLFFFKIAVERKREGYLESMYFHFVAF